MSARMARPTEREYESIKHAAERTDFSVFTIREAIERGDLPAYRLNDKPGSAIRVKVAEVNALFKPILSPEIQAAR